MKMYFWFGYENIQLILKPWFVNNIPDLIGSCSGLFMIGIIYEFIKVYREVKTNGELTYQFTERTLRINFSWPDRGTKLTDE